MTASKKPLITLLTPVYNEEPCLEEYYARVSRFMDATTDYDFEVLLVEDGSSDMSWPMILDICDRDSRFRGFQLSRNFGSHIAIAAGIDQARGDALMTLACDLQDPIETFHAFAEKWRAGARIVWGKRRSRQDETWRVWASNLFFFLLKRYAMPRGSKFTTGSFFLIDRLVVRALQSFKERNRLTFALAAWTGFPQEQVEYDRQERYAGSSGWNFARMITALYDTFLAFSTIPIRLMSAMSFLAFALSIAMAFYFAVAWFFNDAIPGWTSIIVILTFFFGLMFQAIAVIGEYLHRIYGEVVQRPLYLLNARTDHDDAAARPDCRHHH